MAGIAGSITASVGAGGAAVPAAAWAAYKYNRANYLFDQGLRYGRYTAGYSMAIEQAGMYREDIRDLAGYTIEKQDLYHVVGVIFYVITIQLIMAGRLGVHGPVPPGWLMGIHYTCGGLAMLFLTLSTWMAMHAAARATSGMAYLLTRTVRLPIPTPAQLDKARSFGNQYESERLQDMFRVPLAVAPQHVLASEAPEGDSSSKKGGKKPSGKKEYGTKDGKTRRTPKWYAEEREDLYEGGAGPQPSQPEHFEIYAGLQQEWWCHDIYARIALLYYMSSWMHGAAFFIQSHCFGELRAIWPAWSCSIVFSVAHWCVLKCDIIGERRKKNSWSLPMENIAPFTPMLTVFGMSLEYSIIVPSEGMKTFIYLVAWTVYIIHFLWALRMYDLAQPEQVKEMCDLPAQPWWPSTWWIPPAFADAMYLVAPPKSVPDDQKCLQQEMKCAKFGLDAESTKKGPQQRQSLPGLFPWKCMRGALFTMIATWSFIIGGRIIEQIHGEREMLKQEGREERWPSHMQPWMPPWTRREIGSDGSQTPARDEWCHTGGCDRRLTSQEAKIAMLAQKLSSVLTAVSETLDHELAGSRPLPVVQPAPAPLRQANVKWPVELRPSIIACGVDGLVAAIAPGAYSGAAMRFAQDAVVEAQPSAFSFHGLAGLGDLLGASWGHDGLLLTTNTGSLAECAGQPPASSNAVWHCSEVGTRLPTGGSIIKWAATARVPQTNSFRAAVVFEGDETITLFDHFHEGAAGSWEPSGEIRLPIATGALLSFSMSVGADELLISAKSGGVHRLPLGTATIAIAAAPHNSISTADMVWRGTCGLGGGRLAHLASRTTGSDLLSSPELFVSARA